MTIEIKHTTDINLAVDDDGSVVIEMERDTGEWLGRSMTVAEADDFLRLLKKVRDEAAEFPVIKGSA